MLKYSCRDTEVLNILPVKQDHTLLLALNHLRSSITRHGLRSCNLQKFALSIFEVFLDTKYHLNPEKRCNLRLPFLFRRFERQRSRRYY